jgi:hypothetical protein
MGAAGRSPARHAARAPACPGGPSHGGAPVRTAGTPIRATRAPASLAQCGTADGSALRGAAASGTAHRAVAATDGRAAAYLLTVPDAADTTGSAGPCATGGLLATVRAVTTARALRSTARALDTAGPLGTARALSSAGPASAAGPIRATRALGTAGALRTARAVRTAAPVRTARTIRGAGSVRDAGRAGAAGPIRRSAGGACRPQCVARCGGSAAHRTVAGTAGCPADVRAARAVPAGSADAALRASATARPGTR